MPELPEVETMRRGILDIVGAHVVSVERCRCRKRPIHIRPRLDTIRRRMLGRQIAQVERRGKRLLLRLHPDEILVIEPRMTGLVLLADPPDRASLRLRLRLQGGVADQLLFWDRRGLGTIRLLRPGELEQALGEARLGPDALGATADAFGERLGQSRRAVKVALLDQRVVAGIGNLYAAEILHVARIHPEQRCDRLTAKQLTALAAATRAVLKQAIRYEGSTLSDGTYRNAMNRAGRYQNQHRVYNRAGQPCPRCRPGVIVRIVQAGRSTFFCPRCQQK